MVVYVPCVHTGIVLMRSSSITTAASKPGVVSASTAELSAYVPAVNFPPLSWYVPILS